MKFSTSKKKRKIVQQYAWLLSDKQTKIVFKKKNKTKKLNNMLDYYLTNKQINVLI